MVKKEELQGFREPTGNEIEKIYRFERKGSRMDRILNVVFELFAAMFALVLIYNFMYQLVTGSGINGSSILGFFVGLAFGVGLFLLIRNGKKRNRFLKTIKEGHFQVLDCHSVDMEMGEDSMAEGMTTIETEDGQACSDKFPIDSWSVYESVEKGSIPMLLVRQTDYGYYKMFTERRLSGVVD